MNIGITCYPVLGGSGVVATELGIKLAQRGHQVHFIAYSMPFRLPHYLENLFFHQVEVSGYPLFKYPPYTLTLATKMAEVSALWSLDILHVHYAIPHATAAYLAKRILKKDNPKVITTLHGTDITLVGNDKSFFHITKFSIEESDGVTAVSEFLKKKTKEEFVLDREIEVIPNFVETKKFDLSKSSSQRDRFAHKDEKILMHMSNFRPVKRIDDVIRVFYLVNQKIPSKLILVGDGPESSKALSLVQKLKVAERTIFLGEQSAVENIISMADLFLLPSDSESFGLAALEAMSCGVPVIGTNTGGLPEVVINGETGYLTNLGDVDFMAKKGVELLADEGKLNRFKQNARKVAVEKFDSDLIMPLYERYYHRILDSKG
jgi:N-acetyl-alpha-D-glucosaminyl L-malate synthase BshA